MPEQTVPVVEPHPHADPARTSLRLPWRQVAWLVLLGAVLSLQLWFPNLESEQHDTYSVEVAGRKALFELAEAQHDSGHLPPVRRNLDPISRAMQRMPRDGTFCLLGPARYPTDSEWNSLLDWVDRGGTLLVAARWGDPELVVDDLGVKVRSPTIDSLLPATGTGKAGEGKEEKEKSKSTKEPAKDADAEDADADEDKAAEPEKKESSGTPGKTPAASPSTSKSKRKKSGPLGKEPGEKRTNLSGKFHNTLQSDAKLDWQSTAEIVAPGGEVIARLDNQPQIVRVGHGTGSVLFIASDYVFSNDALFAPSKDNGFFAYRILESISKGSEILVFDEFLNSTGTPKVVGLLLNRSLLPLTLQLFALLVLFALTGTRRFGGMLPRDTPARHDITEHINALGLLYYRVNNARALLGVVLDQTRQALRLHGDRFPEPRTWAALAQRLRQDPEVMKQLLVDAAAAVQDPKLSRRRGATLLRQLSELRQAVRQG